MAGAVPLPVPVPAGVVLLSLQPNDARANATVTSDSTNRRTMLVPLRGVWDRPSQRVGVEDAALLGTGGVVVVVVPVPAGPDVPDPSDRPVAHHELDEARVLARQLVPPRVLAARRGLQPPGHREVARRHPLPAGFLAARGR